MTTLLKPSHRRACDRQQGRLRLSRGQRLPKGHALGLNPAWIIALLLLLVAVAGIVLWAMQSASADSLHETHLAGLRPPIPINIVLLLDVSCSFADYDQMRRQALEEVLTWVPKNLRGDDTLAIVSFADDAVLTMPVTTITDIAANNMTLSHDLPDGGNTRIIPALGLAAQSTSGDAGTSVIAVTDTAVSDAARLQTDPLIAQLGAATMSVVMPREVSMESGWRDAFGWEAEFKADADDSQDIAVAIGRALAHATGQTLEK